MKVDWGQLFIPTESLIELVIRGTVMYVLLFAALRLLGRRHGKSLSMMDLLVMVLIADAAQNAMAAEYRSITGGLVLCGTLLSWNYFFDWLSFRFPFCQRILEPAPLPIIKNGQFLKRNLKEELLTQDEVLGQLREQEIFDINDIALAFIESNGALSVKRRTGKPTSGHTTRDTSSLR